MAEIVDFYSESNHDSATQYGTGKSGQSFTGDGGTLNNSQFYIRRIAAITGDGVATIYAHSGTFGTSSVPTGSVLATSGSVDLSTISTSVALVTFTFTGGDKIVLTNGTKYCTVLETTVSSGEIQFGRDSSSPTHSGNFFDFFEGDWVASAIHDSIFYVYRDSIDTGTGWQSKSGWF